MPTPDDTTAEPFSLEAAIKRIEANSDLAVDYGQAANERLGKLEQRLARIERHLGLNGITHDGDTEPAPPTQPENERPGEV